MKTLGWFQKVMICLVAGFFFSPSLWALNLDFDQEIRKQESLNAELVSSLEEAQEGAEEISVASRSQSAGFDSKRPSQAFSVRLKRIRH